MQATCSLTFSRTSFSKFFSELTFTQMQPSFKLDVATLYEALGTADMTTSEMARHCSREFDVGLTTCFGWYNRRGMPVAALALEVDGRFVYSWMLSMSAEKTRAPSLDKRAASGRPTTSELLV